MDKLELKDESNSLLTVHKISKAHYDKGNTPQEALLGVNNLAAKNKARKEAENAKLQEEPEVVQSTADSTASPSQEMELAGQTEKGEDGL